jgi:CelD/BcsL family acetyltransferase involved in cellulose biosynthesis
MDYSCIVLRPSRLGREEISRWKEMQRQSSHLQRAFLSPAFALACEAAGFDARVAVIRQDDRIVAIFPFQYRALLHKWMRLGEPIGGHLSDASGIIAEPGWRTSAAELTRLCGLSVIHIACLADGQPQFGLETYQVIPNYIVDLSEGYESYFEGLQSRNADFVRDTGRRFRQAARALGDLAVTHSDTVSTTILERLISQKRAQYKRTNTGDALSDVRVLRTLEHLAAQRDEDCGVLYTKLEAGGRVVAEHFGLHSFGVLNYWFPVYDIEAQKYSPGRLMLWELIKAVPQHGITTIDFGEGTSQYKRQFSNKLISSYKANWVAGDMQSKFAKAYQSLYWRAQSLSQATAE